MRKVFGIGLNKTGTSTLGECLRHLGYSHVSHRSDMLSAFQQGNIRRIIAETRRYDSFEDWPWPLVYRSLYEEYGSEASYILTVRRTPEIWVELLKQHCLTTHPERPMRMSVYGYKYPHGYEEEHMAFYIKHNTDVRQFFAGKKEFLEICWEQGDSWGKLCSFLGHEAPTTSFPHIRPGAEGIPPGIRAQNEANIAEQLRRLQRTSDPR